jgi:hypothetical protein
VPPSHTSAQDCPYLLLEKSKNPSFTAYAVASAPAVSFAAVTQPILVTNRNSRIADSSNLYLRCHVLLI